MAADPRLIIVEALFPQLDLTKVAANRPNDTPEQLADWILQNQKDIPLKPKPSLPRTKSLASVYSEGAVTNYSDIDDSSTPKSFTDLFISTIFSIFRRLFGKSLCKRDDNAFVCGICFDEIQNDKMVACTGQNSVHFFCRSCIRGMAKAVTESAQMHNSGIGLKCMEYQCPNIIIFSEIKAYIPRKVRKQIDYRMMEENLGLAGVNIERCPSCNFALEMDAPITVNKVFSCIKCYKNFCRLCALPYDDDHFGFSCEDTSNKKDQETKDRLREKKINESVVRRCDNCNFQFMKSEGCNKVTCRCGIAYCYVCRAKISNYDHFCSHGTLCKCVGKCRLWEKTETIHENEIKKVEAEFV